MSKFNDRPQEIKMERPEGERSVQIIITYRSRI